LSTLARIAVVGSGVSGLVAAWLLSRRFEVHLYEAEPRLGGHTHTVNVETPDGRLALDTGFLVHNRRTYPNLVRLFEEIGVATQPSDMSFSVADPRTGLEYGSRGAGGFFAQARNLVRPAHYRLLAEIVRFNREASALLTRPDAGDLTLAGFLAERAFDDTFSRYYLLPMASAIWSAPMDAMGDFPVFTFVRFFGNHGLLGITGQPTWRAVTGGSHRYIPALVAPLGDRVHTGTGVTRVMRSPEGVTLTFAARAPERFDHVVLACHGDQAFRLLGDPSDAEVAVMGQFRTSVNDTWLHTDASWLPVNHRARASWNYRLADDDTGAPTVTYDLNRLQGLTTGQSYCVTLNPRRPIPPEMVLGRFPYRHPLYDLSAVRAQGRWTDVSGVNRTHFCGAYWGYGFHEDGVTSAVRVAASLGVAW
jgi:predicted NAD/FAD-binding protein